MHRTLVKGEASSVLDVLVRVANSDGELGDCWAHRQQGSQFELRKINLIQHCLHTESAFHPSVKVTN